MTAAHDTSGARRGMGSGWLAVTALCFGVACERAPAEIPAPQRSVANAAVAFDSTPQRSMDPGPRFTAGYKVSQNTNLLSPDDVIADEGEVGTPDAEGKLTRQELSDAMREEFDRDAARRAQDPAGTSACEQNYRTFAGINRAFNRATGSRGDVMPRERFLLGCLAAGPARCASPRIVNGRAQGCTSAPASPAELIRALQPQGPANEETHSGPTPIGGEP